MLYKKGEKIDLHMHSAYSSDGKHTIKDLLKFAEKEDIKVISITDHNTLAAYEELKKIDIAKFYTSKIITGVEINMGYKGNMIECLAYNFDVEKLKALPFLQADTLLQIQREAAKLMVSHYRDLGLIIDDKFIKNVTVNAASPFFDELASHKENLWFIKKYKITHFGYFYRNILLYKKSIGYVDFTHLFHTFESLKKAVNDAGGILVLAHPIGTYKIDHWTREIKNIAANGLVDGLECIHRKMTKKNTRFLLKLADQHKLVKTAGSDFHKIGHMMGKSKASGLDTIIY